MIMDVQFWFRIIITLENSKLSPSIALHLRNHILWFSAKIILFMSFIILLTMRRRKKWILFYEQIFTPSNELFHGINNSISLYLSLVCGIKQPLVFMCFYSSNRFQNKAVLFSPSKLDTAYSSSHNASKLNNERYLGRRCV